ncbi:MAG: hypothetical protein EAZ97_07585 [Bacteroidetes bacterium]|nr:MAG: hypothetical protein EAZ97_07585 [Bacteroidota bacterium]
MEKQELLAEIERLKQQLAQSENALKTSENRYEMTLTALRASMEKSEDNLMQIIDNLPTPLTITRTADNSLVFANKTAIDLYEIQDKPPFLSKELSLYDDPNKQIELLSLLKRKGFVENLEVCMRSLSGRKLWVLFAMTPIDIRGEKCILHVHYNISARKMVEEQLQDLNDELRSTQEVLAIEMQESERKNLQLTDSMRYAYTIQQAILPEKSHFKEDFKENFVIYLPKDIVSGDFYWFSKIRRPRSPRSIDSETLTLAVVDCTGHGVPGAFMSIVGSILLDEVINQKQLFIPADALTELDRLIKQVLKQKENLNNDTMDICLCIMEKYKHVTSLRYSGANRPLWYVKNGILCELKGRQKSVGGKPNKRAFTNNFVELKKDDILYLSSDGFADQVGENGERYGTTRLKEKINETKDLSLKEQKKYLLNDFKSHTKSQNQRDDLTLIAVKID